MSNEVQSTAPAKPLEEMTVEELRDELRDARPAVSTLSLMRQLFEGWRAERALVGKEVA